MSLFYYGQLGLVNVFDSVLLYEALPALWATWGPGSEFTLLRILRPQPQGRPHSTSLVCQSLFKLGSQISLLDPPDMILILSF